MMIPVRYWSWFKDLTGTEREEFEVPDQPITLDEFLAGVRARHPRLEQVRRSTLVAVGLDYVPGSRVLRDGDEVSLFPPVQGG